MNLDILPPFAYGIPAQGKIKITGVPAVGDTVVVNGTTLTMGPTGDFDGADETIAAASLTAALAAGVTSVTASCSGNVISIEAVADGAAGNAITLAKTGTAITVSGTTLTRGVDAPGLTRIITVVPTGTTGALVDGNNMFALATVNCGRKWGMPVWLTNILALDIDDISTTKPIFDLYFFDRTVTLPAQAAAWNVTDADMAYCVGGPFQIGGTNAWTANGALNGTAMMSGINWQMLPYNGTNLYLAVKARSSFTPGTAGSIKFKLAFIIE